MAAPPGFFPFTFPSPFPVVNGTPYWIGTNADQPYNTNVDFPTITDVWGDFAVPYASSPTNPFGGSDLGPFSTLPLQIGNAGHMFGSAVISTPGFGIPPIQIAQSYVADASITVDRGLYYVDSLAGGTDTLIRLFVWADSGGAPGALIAASDPVVMDFIAPFPAPSGGFFVGYPWRIIVTDLQSVITTYAERLLTNREIGLVLDDSSTINFDVWPDDFVVNGLWTDGYPRIAQSNRLVYAFRREAQGGPTDPWVCRAAGIIMSPEDEGDDDLPISHIAAWDPWNYLSARPCMAFDGSLPSQQFGFNFLPPAFPGGTYIALDLLLNTIVNEGMVHIDAGDGSRIGEGPQYTDWGGTAFYQGTLEVTPAIDFNVQRGDSVGTAWSNLVSVGNMDIVLTPIFDPVNRPGYTHELSIYYVAGTDRHDAVFGWDMMNHCVSHMDRMHDGTPGMFFNKGLYYTSLGAPIPATGPLVNAASVADFGSWWSQQFFPAQTDTDPTGSATFILLQQALILSKQGKRTVTLNPIPERAPLPFLKYNLGDRVAVYASNRLRVISNGLQRVQAIPISIDDDGIEHVNSLLLSPDYRGEPSLPSAPGQQQITTVIAPLTSSQIAHRFRPNQVH